MLICLELGEERNAFSKRVFMFSSTLFLKKWEFFWTSMMSSYLAQCANMMIFSVRPTHMSCDHNT